VEGKGNDLLSPFFEAVREEFSQMREKKNREQGLERGSARAFFFAFGPLYHWLQGKGVTYSQSCGDALRQ
jgi:hypothetical protein